MNRKELFAELLINQSKKLNQEEFDAFFANFVAFLKFKKLEKLLPEIYHHINSLKDDENDSNGKLILARNSDLEKLKEQIEKYKTGLVGENPEVVIDENIVGGYILKSETKMKDASYRKALVDLYGKLLNV